VAIAATRASDPYKIVVIVEKVVDCAKVVVASEAVNLGSGYAILDGLRDNCRFEDGFGVAMAKSTVGAVQGVNVASTFQCTGARLTNNARVAGMAASANSRNHPVVMGRIMVRCPVFVAGIASEVWPVSYDFSPDNIRSITNRSDFMVVVVLVMAGGTEDGRTSWHIVSSGSDSIAIMSG
jgi:hypothetical protein